MIINNTHSDLIQSNNEVNSQQSIIISNDYNVLNTVCSNDTVVCVNW